VEVFAAVAINIINNVSLAFKNKAARANMAALSKQA